MRRTFPKHVQACTMDTPAPFWHNNIHAPPQITRLGKALPPALLLPEASPYLCTLNLLSHL